MGRLRFADRLNSDLLEVWNVAPIRGGTSLFHNDFACIRLNPKVQVLRLFGGLSSNGRTYNDVEAPMSHMLMRPFRVFLKNEEGVAAVECALMLALVVVICIIVLTPTPPRTSAGEQPILVLESQPQ